MAQETSGHASADIFVELEQLARAADARSFFPHALSGYAYNSVGDANSAANTDSHSGF
jgi:hypothetical protein